MGVAAMDVNRKPCSTCAGLLGAALVALALAAAPALAQVPAAMPGSAVPEVFEPEGQEVCEAVGDEDETGGEDASQEGRVYLSSVVVRWVPCDGSTCVNLPPARN